MKEEEWKGSGKRREGRMKDAERGPPPGGGRYFSHFSTLTAFSLLSATRGGTSIKGLPVVRSWHRG